MHMVGWERKRWNHMNVQDFVERYDPVSLDSICDIWYHQLFSELFGNRGLAYRSVASSLFTTVCFLSNLGHALFFFVPYHWKSQFFQNILLSESESFIFFYSLLNCARLAADDCKFQFQSGHSLCVAGHMLLLRLGGSSMMATAPKWTFSLSSTGCLGSAASP